MIADGGGHSAEQRRHLRTGLREAEDVVDEQEHVLALRVTEVLRHRERAQADAKSRARGLGHLTIDQRGPRLLRLLDVDHATLLHLEPQVVAFARPLADPAEH